MKNSRVVEEIFPNRRAFLVNCSQRWRQTNRHQIYGPLCTNTRESSWRRTGQHPRAKTFRLISNIGNLISKIRVFVIILKYLFKRTSLHLRRNVLMSPKLVLQTIKMTDNKSTALSSDAKFWGWPPDVPRTSLLIFLSLRTAYDSLWVANFVLLYRKKGFVDSIYIKKIKIQLVECTGTNFSVHVIDIFS